MQKHVFRKTLSCLQWPGLRTSNTQSEDSGDSSEAEEELLPTQGKRVNKKFFFKNIIYEPLILCMSIVFMYA